MLISMFNAHVILQLIITELFYTIEYDCYIDEIYSIVQDVNTYLSGQNVTIPTMRVGLICEGDDLIITAWGDNFSMWHHWKVLKNLTTV